MSIFKLIVVNRIIEFILGHAMIKPNYDIVETETNINCKQIHTKPYHSMIGVYCHWHRIFGFFSPFSLALSL